MAEMAPTVSVILPVYNERENLKALVDRLLPVLEKTCGGSFEVVFVDDGSRDGSAEVLDSFHLRDPRFRALHLTRNFGHQAALQAGLDVSLGRAVILMDADLQDPPELVERFMECWQQGYDVVYATRKSRKEAILKRAAYAVFYRTLKAVAEIDLPLDAGDFCLLDRRVVDVLVRLRERNRFIRGLRSWVGFKQMGLDYERDSRYAGNPKYTLRKLIHLALSGYVGFSTMPLRIAAWLGFCSAFLGFVIAVWAVATKLMDIPSPRGWASTLAVILFVGGIQLLVLGVIGEYLGRVYDEVRHRPMYIVSSRVGFPDAAMRRARDGAESVRHPFDS